MWQQHGQQRGQQVSFFFDDYYLSCLLIATATVVNLQTIVLVIRSLTVLLLRMATALLTMKAMGELLSNHCCLSHLLTATAAVVIPTRIPATKFSMVLPREVVTVWSTKVATAWSTTMAMVL